MKELLAAHPSHREYAQDLQCWSEFKREYVEDIKNTIAAFANCDGGALYIGVDDDGTVRGIDNVDD